MTKNVEKGTDEFADTLFSEKKSSKNNLEKGTDDLADTLLMEKKYLTFNVDKSTYELSFMKQTVSTIFRKGLIRLRVNTPYLRDGLNLISSF